MDRLCAINAINLRNSINLQKMANLAIRGYYIHRASKIRPGLSVSSAKTQLLGRRQTEMVVYMETWLHERTSGNIGGHTFTDRRETKSTPLKML